PSVDNSLRRRHEGCLPPGDTLRLVRGSSARLERRLQPVDQLRLRLDQLRACLDEAEPTGAIDLRELLHLPRPWWPFERERVAHEAGDVEVALGAPGGDDLAGLLPDRAEIDE